VENNLKVKKGILFRKQAQLSLPPKKTLGVRVETNIPKNRSNSYAGTLTWKVFIGSQGIENDQTIFFYVTAET